MLLKNFFALIDYKLAIVIAELSDMCFGLRRLQNSCEPTISSILGHKSVLMQLIKLLMSFITKGFEFTISHRTDRNGRSLMDSHVRVARRKLRTHI